MRIRDLFCGAGACSVGYQRAGLTVVGGVDIIDHPDYPFSLLVKDVMEMSPEQIADGADVIHASPPCQADTTMSNRWRGHGGKADSHPRLIAETRELLEETGLPYIIENVPGAKRHMRNPVTLTGGMFGLGVHRPRLFETNFPMQAPPRSRPSVGALGVYGKAHDGRRLFTRKDGSVQRAPRTLEEAQRAMGIDWMAWDDLREAVPPAYTEYIGRELLRAIS